MKDVKDITVMVIDYGYFYPIAERLSRDCKKVYYCTNWQESMPKWNQYSIGMGISSVERVDNMWEKYSEVDLFVFPDLYFGDLQEWLVSQGKIVFGARRGEDLEIYRDQLKELMEEVKLPVNKYQVCYGFDALKKYLKGKENLYIKINLVRGEMETFHYENDRLSESRLEKIQHILGPFKNESVFIVESPIEAVAETGYDGICIDGKYPELTMFGCERKDKAYAAKIIPYKSIPKCVSEVNEKLSPFFEQANYRSCFSSEVRVTDKGQGYFIDATCRFGNPVGFLMCEMFDNFSEVIWQSANGIVPIIKSTHKYGVQVIIKSTWASESPQEIFYPDKVSDRVKIQCKMMKDGRVYYIPLSKEHEEVGIGSIIGLGSTIEEAIKDAEKISEMVEGDSISIDCSCLEGITEEMEKLSIVGFTGF